MTKEKKQVKKEENIDAISMDLALGGIIICTNDFSDGMIPEKIFFILGFIIFFVGVVRSVVRYKKLKKKGLMYLYIFLGAVAVFFLISLLILNFIFI